MAYAATITYNGASAAGAIRDGELVEVLITEAEASSTSEATVTLVPGWYEIRRFDLVKTSGTGATFDPVIGTATGVAGIDVAARIKSAATASPIREMGEVTTRTTSAGALYYRSQCDAGTDNALSIRIHFKRLGSR